MKRFRMFFRFDREVKWLEEMAARGWLLCGKLMTYSFQRCTPDSCTIRIDYREFKNAGEFANYRALFEDSGWEHIAGSRYSGTQYFLKLRDSSTEDIFSDRRSRAGRYKRMANAWLGTAVAMTPLFVVYGNIGWMGMGRPFTPAEWYFTPGLWEMEGLSFWFAFLFETPFALLRGMGGLLPLLPLLLYVGFAVKAWRLYKREESDAVR